MATGPSIQECMHACRLQNWPGMTAHAVFYSYTGHPINKSSIKVTYSLVLLKINLMVIQVWLSTTVEATWLSFFAGNSIFVDC